VGGKKVRCSWADATPPSCTSLPSCAARTLKQRPQFSAASPILSSLESADSLTGPGRGNETYEGTKMLGQSYHTHRGSSSSQVDIGIRSCTLGGGVSGCYDKC
jgi:hypothetical protein